MEEWNEGGEIGTRFLSTTTGSSKKSFNLRLFKEYKQTERSDVVIFRL